MAEAAAGIHFRQYGSGGLHAENPPLLLIHGAGSHHLAWPPSVRRLKNQLVFALDLPGHGESGGRPGATISEYAERVLDWMRAVGLTRAVVCGHSMGGAIAQVMALRVPRSVAALALVATSAHLRVAESLLRQSADRRTFPQAVDWFIERAFGSAAAPPIVERVRETALAMGHEVFHADFQATDQFDVRARLGEINVPALVICGEEDRLTPPSLSEKLAAGLPRSELHLVEGAGHMVMLERPDVVADHLSNFFEGAVPVS